MSGDRADIEVDISGRRVRLTYLDGLFYLEFWEDGKGWVEVGRTNNPRTIERLGLACRQVSTFAEACNAA